MQEQSKIPVFTAVLMNINVMVGVGIYFMPQMMGQVAGAFSFLGWAAAGLILLPVVWTIATAARLFPGSGGFYNYGTSGLNSTAGFIALWAYMLGFLSTAAAQLTFLKNLMAVNGGITCIAAMPFLANAALVIIIACLNLFDVRLISKIQGFVTILKLLPMVAVIALFAFYWDGSLLAGSNTINFSNIALTVPMAIFGYWGFESCTSTSHLIEGGSKKASFVLLTAFFITTALYSLFHFGVSHIMGIDAIIAQGAVGFTNFFGIANPEIVTALGYAIVVLLILALSNAVYGVSLGNGANMFSLASKNHLFGSNLFCKVNSANRPYFIIFFQALVVFFLMSFVSSEQILVALSNFGLITAMLITIFAVLATQARNKSYNLNSLVAVIAIGACATLIYFTWCLVGIDNTTRLMNIVPFVIGITGGLVMFYCKKGCKASC